MVRSRSPEGSKWRGPRENKERTEDDLVSLLPHLCNNRLSRVDDTDEPDLDVLVLAKRLQDMFARDTHGTQAVKDGPKKRKSGRGCGRVKSVPS